MVALGRPKTWQPGDTVLAQVARLKVHPHGIIQSLAVTRGTMDELAVLSVCEFMGMLFQGDAPCVVLHNTDMGGRASHSLTVPDQVSSAEGYSVLLRVCVLCS